MTTEQYRTHFTFWAALKSPLILGNDVTAMSKSDFGIISNPEVIAINQDPLGLSASLRHKRYEGIGLFAKSVEEVWAGPLANQKMVISRY